MRRSSESPAPCWRKETSVQTGIRVLRMRALPPQMPGVFSIALALRRLSNSPLSSGESDSITWTSDSINRAFILNLS
ncbi:hypothetical protein [Microcoleus sp. herbarium12]|uniref:hypothetical protein n=1 Tax=Microcoleus sp. herbarium12 TaxID=3055437 RepID=UPI002FD2FD15